MVAIWEGRVRDYIGRLSYTDFPDSFKFIYWSVKKTLDVEKKTTGFAKNKTTTTLTVVSKKLKSIANLHNTLFRRLELTIFYITTVSVLNFPENISATAKSVN